MAMRRVALATARDDPFSSLTRQMGQWVDQVLGTAYRPYCPAEVWRPAVNLYEDDGHYCVIVDLAGVKSEQIDLKADEGQLILSGVREPPLMLGASRTLRVHLMEIDHGRVSRVLKLPQDVDADTIEATYKGGYLCVQMPKKPR